MKNNKTYTTLAGAYTSAENAGAERFTNEAYYTQACVCIASTLKGGKNANKVAMWNLVKYENTLCALECVKTADGKTAYKWTAIGHFDSDGLLYPMRTEAEAPKQAEVQTDEQPKAKKSRAHRKPAEGKGDSNPTKTALQLELDTLAGTGDNSAAHKIMCKHGLKDGRSDEYQKVWRGYWWTIR